MAIPKSEKLIQEESLQTGAATPSFVNPIDTLSGDVIKIKPIDCLNDWVAVLQFKIETNIAMPTGEGYKNEGIVIGVGSGVPDGAGGMTKSALNVGDVVMFQDRAIAARIQSDSEPYAGKTVLMLMEKNIFCKLKPVPFEILNA